MVRTKFLQFRRQGDITHGPSQLELSFLYLTPLPNALFNLTEFMKIAQRVLMGCTIMHLWTDRWMDGWMDGRIPC